MQFKRRDGLLSSIFGILTCGLYSLYFWYQYGEDVNVICAEDGKTTQNYIVAWLLGIITCGIYSLYWTYNLASRLDTASKKYGVNVESPVFFTLFMNIPFLSYFYSCDVLNKFQEKYEEMYPNGNTYSGNVPPVPPYNGGNTAQTVGAQIGSQFKSAVQDVGNSIKNTAQSAMPTCKNCGATILPGKNYCKRCGYPVNGAAPQSKPMNGPMQQNPMNGAAPQSKPMNGSTPQNSNPFDGGVKEPSLQQIPPMPKSSTPESEIKLTFQTEGIMQEKPVQQDEKETVKAPSQESAPKAPVCPKCGNKVKPGDRFCIHCGSKII